VQDSVVHFTHFRGEQFEDVVLANQPQFLGGLQRLIGGFWFSQVGAQLGTQVA
jgi:hypothetical protein